jgi:hypothetical protein
MLRTKRDFESFYREFVLPRVREAYESDGRVDAIARREEWHNTVDAMVEDRSLPPSAHNWECPW